MTAENPQGLHGGLSVKEIFSARANIKERAAVCSGISKLFQIPQVNVFPGPAGYSPLPCTFCFQAIIFSESRIIAGGTAEGRQFGSGRSWGIPASGLSDSGRIEFSFFLAKGGNIFWDIAIHLDNGIGYMKIGAGASCDNDGRDTAYFIEKSGLFQ